MSKLPHVFSDASVTQTQTVLSVVSTHLGIKKQIVLNKVVSTHKAEELALLVAKKLTLGTKCMYFTDNLHLAYRYGQEVNWIPRELNKEADKLTKVTKNALLPSGIGDYIIKHYSYTKRLKLVNAILKKNYEDLQQVSRHIGNIPYLGKQLVRTFFTAKEYPKQVSKKLTNINQFKDKEIIQLFKTIKKD